MGSLIVPKCHVVEFNEIDASPPTEYIPNFRRARGEAILSSPDAGFSDAKNTS